MLLIHACCADCSLKLIDAYKKENKLSGGVAIYYYNPNIMPRTEYLARLEAMQTVLKDLPYRLIIPNWSPKEYFAQVKIIARKITDKKERCPLCWTLRLEQTFKYAREHGFGEVTSTLVTSIYHDQEKLRSIGSELAQKYGIGFYVPKEIACDLKTGGFYKQNYCGCIYSLKEKMEERFFTEATV